MSAPGSAYMIARDDNARRASESPKNSNEHHASVAAYYALRDSYNHSAEAKGQDERRRSSAATGASPERRRSSLRDIFRFNKEKSVNNNEKRVNNKEKRESIPWAVGV